MDVIRWLGLPAGVFILIGTGGGLIRTLVVPRGLSSALTSRVERSIRAGFLFFAGRFEHFRTKDRILAVLGPVTMLWLLITWLTSFLVAFALILWPINGGSFPRALRESGSSMFTLGFAQPATAPETLVHFAAAATGLVVVALQIAYLPTLYSAFNRREMLVTTLQSRAGIPAWGPEILARHRTVNLVDTMPRFYSDWEQWAADVAETHANYPVLISFRSPHPLRSWVLALLSVMDSAALYTSLCPSTAPSEARICLRMGFTALRDIALALGMPFDPDPLPTDPIELSYDEFLTGVKRLEETRFPMERTPEDAWPHFKGWRVNYEALAYTLADYVVAPPSLWSGSRKRVPGLVIPPLRPVDRRPDDPDPSAEGPARTEWSI